MKCDVCDKLAADVEALVEEVRKKDARILELETGIAAEIVRYVKYAQIERMLQDIQNQPPGGAAIEEPVPGAEEGEGRE